MEGLGEHCSRCRPQKRPTGGRRYTRRREMTGRFMSRIYDYFLPKEVGGGHVEESGPGNSRHGFITITTTRTTIETQLSKHEGDDDSSQQLRTGDEDDSQPQLRTDSATLGSQSWRERKKRYLPVVFFVAIIALFCFWGWSFGNQRFDGKLFKQLAWKISGSGAEGTAHEDVASEKTRNDDGCDERRALHVIVSNKHGTFQTKGSEQQNSRHLDTTRRDKEWKPSFLKNQLGNRSNRSKKKGKLKKKKVRT